MGGNALQTFTRRYERTEFEQILPEIISKVKQKFTDAKSTKYYFEKESFGDADILVLVDKPINFDIKEWLYAEFNTKEIFVNNSVYSFEYKELQVDLILISKKHWETAYEYYAFNDLHNLLGKLCHKFGLKWGWQGLVYPYRIEGKTLGDITVSMDYKQVLKFIGLDVERYDKGFSNLTEIYEYVISSPYFNPKLFDYENLNYVNRKRDRKRSTYSGFLEYIEPIRNKEYFYFYHKKSAYLGLIDYYFPGFLRKYRELEKIEQRKKEVSEYYNGNLLMKYFHISGPELGKYMGNFLNHFGTKEKMEDWILENKTTVCMEKFSEINKLEIKMENL